MARPRIADDFAAIRARIEELRRERNQAAHNEDKELIDELQNGRLTGKSLALRLLRERLQRFRF
jgi:hypothetical protein